MSNKGVAPIFGVMIMVVISIFLALIIVTFGLGLGEKIEQEPRAAVEYSVSQEELRISINTMDNSDYLVIRGFENDFSSYRTMDGFEQERPSRQVKRNKVFYITNAESYYTFNFSKKVEGELLVYASITNKTIDKSIQNKNITNGEFVNTSKLDYVNTNLIKEIEYSNKNP